MGRDKGLALLGGRPLVSHVLARLSPQCGALAVNAPEAFRAVATAAGAKLIDEAPYAGMGPLGGIRAGLAWARSADPEANHVLIAPVDMPFLPTDLVDRLSLELAASDAAIVIEPDDRTIPVLGLWPIAALGRIEQVLRANGNLSVRALLDQIQWRGIDFPADTLADVDDLAALAAAEARIAAAAPRP